MLALHFVFHSIQTYFAITVIQVRSGLIWINPKIQIFFSISFRCRKNYSGDEKKALVHDGIKNRLSKMLKSYSRGDSLQSVKNGTSLLHTQYLKFTSGLPRAKGKLTKVHLVTMNAPFLHSYPQPFFSALSSHIKRSANFYTGSGL